MIQNDSQLDIAREQLLRAEKALRAITADVRPFNEARFLLMAEGYVEVIQGLRAEIDAFLGIDAVRQFQPELVLRLEGKGIQLGDTPSSVISRVLDSLRRGLQSIVEATEANQPHGTIEVAARKGGRRKRWIEQLGDLPLIGVTAGSVQVQLGEPASLSQRSGLLESQERDFYESVLRLFRTGLAYAAGQETVDQLPESLMQPVLNAVRKLVPPSNGAVGSITFSGRAMGVGANYRVTPESRQRLEAALKQVAPLSGATSVEGVIREVDLDNKSFALRERPGGSPEIACKYQEHDEDDVKSYLDKRVVVRGAIQLSRTGQQTMMVEVIEATAGVRDDEQSIEGDVDDHRANSNDTESES